MESESKPGKRSRIVSNLLSSAVQLWLRSQLDHVENLQIQIDSGDRQVMSGYVSKIALQAEKAVYKGLHLSQAQVTSTNIRLNLGQVVRGKPLRLMEVIPVEIRVFLTAADLTASLQAPLLTEAIAAFLKPLLRSQAVSNWGLDAETAVFQELQTILTSGRITLQAIAVDANQNVIPLSIQTGLALASPRQLQLVQPELARLDQPALCESLTDLFVDLGSDVAIEQITLETEGLACSGEISVNP